jgi:hypothetical protein
VALECGRRKITPRRKIVVYNFTYEPNPNVINVSNDILSIVDQDIAEPYRISVLGAMM